MATQSRMRQELEEERVLINRFGVEIAHLDKKGKLVINPCEMYRFALWKNWRSRQNLKRSFLYKHFGLRGTYFPDRAVDALLEDMQEKGLLRLEDKRIIPLNNLAGCEEVYPEYIPMKEKFAGLEPL